MHNGEHNVEPGGVVQNPEHTKKYDKSQDSKDGVGAGCNVRVTSLVNLHHCQN